MIARDVAPLPPSHRCTVQALLEEHEGRGDVLKHLQAKGVVKLGELTCEVRPVGSLEIQERVKDRGSVVKLVAGRCLSSGQGGPPCLWLRAPADLWVRPAGGGL